MPLPDLFDACRYNKVAVCPYSPLAGGFLTGKYKRNRAGRVSLPDNSRAALSDGYGDFPGRWWDVLTAVEQVAEEVDATPLQIAIQWAKNIPGVTSIPIVGATSARQLGEALEASGVHISEAQHQRITDAGNWAVAAAN
jgi:aryl-alcohol dehydrogenase-like predicted oxidoreductase